MMKPHEYVRKANARRRRWILAFALGALSTFSHLLDANAANESVKNSPYYEDDAWYDVSEWFDGNDYNPTDEAIGRWDDETYDRADALTSSDTDNDIDWNASRYGYYDNDKLSDNKWFYDYYDYGNLDYSDYDDDGYWDYTANYYDYDNDGVYDSVS
ncbi:MAG: hypothetical protein KDB23_27625, partial [Planctomycetales bacterium]|nr:hypothetical protein [Planctomycetales bacterium]